MDHDLVAICKVVKLMPDDDQKFSLFWSLQLTLSKTLYETHEVWQATEEEAAQISVTAASGKGVEWRALSSRASSSNGLAEAAEAYTTTMNQDDGPGPKTFIVTRHFLAATGYTTVLSFEAQNQWFGPKHFGVIEVFRVHNCLFGFFHECLKAF